MNSQEIKHYAKALAEIGQEQNIWSELYSSLLELSEKLVIAELKNFLVSRQFALQEKEEYINKIFKLKKEATNFVKMLIEANGLVDLGKILIAARKIYNENNEIADVEVESFPALDDSEKNKLKKTLETKLNKKVQLSCLENKDLLGGVKIKVGDLIVDNSVLGKINQLKNSLSK